MNHPFSLFLLLFQLSVFVIMKFLLCKEKLTFWVVLEIFGSFLRFLLLDFVNSYIFLMFLIVKREESIRS